MDYILQMLAKTDWPILVGMLAMFYLYNEKINKKFEKFEEKMDKKFEIIDKKFEDVNRKIDKMDDKLLDIDRRLCRLEGAFASKDCCVIKDNNKQRMAE